MNRVMILFATLNGFETFWAASPEGKIMAFDNNYPKRKDWRRPYYDGRKHSAACRHGGICSYCRNNRLSRVNRVKNWEKEEN